MPNTGFLLQILAGSIITIKLAFLSLFLGLGIGLIGSLTEALPFRWLRYLISSVLFVIRGLPELLVLFFMYFGLTVILSNLVNHYVEISAFGAGVTSLGLIFGAYAAQVFRGAFLAVDKGQTEAARALGFSTMQIVYLIQIPQAWRHALPGLGNLWLVLLKDTAIVTLIGLSDMMNAAKIAATTTNEPFTYYLIAAFIYLIITSISQKIIHYFTLRANRYLPNESPHLFA